MHTFNLQYEFNHSFHPLPLPQDASRDRQAEVELVESRLRACRAERMEIENGRVSRLKSLLQSPRVQEPAPAKLNFDLTQEQLDRVSFTH